MSDPAKRGARAGMVLGVSAALAGNAGEAADGGKAAAPQEFSAELRTDPETEWTVIVLRKREGRIAGSDLEARIAVDAGANLFSLRIGGEELLYQPDRLADLKAQRAGTPILFPTPNRVRDARMVFEGQSFEFEANSERNFIHGLVKGRPWRSGEVKADARGASAEVFIDWDETQPEWRRFPIKHRLTVSYALHREGLRIGFAVQNQSEQRLPFGFALHPYFRVPGERRHVLVEVPAETRMEADKLLPTGKLLPVAGTRFDLRRATTIEGLELDDVFFGVVPAKPPAFELRDKGLRVTLGGSKEFTHVVLYTPPGRPFFCVENQTSSTDAHNLWAQGLKKESHLLVVDKGKTARGQLDWRIGRIGR
jgi:aldose 1-epimerase